MLAKMALSLLCISVAAPAAADQIRVSGVLSDSSSSIADFGLSAAGFELFGTVVGGGLQQCGPCLPRTPFTLTALYELEGPVGFNGDITTATGIFTFESASFFVPTLAAGESAALRRAFTFVGAVTLAGSSIQHQLFGQGVATARFVHAAGDGIFPVSIRYDLASTVPEPGSMLLLGSGLACAALLRRRRQSSAGRQS